MTAVVAMVFGMVALGSLVAAIFFYRYWRESRDRLFLWFSSAFVILAVQRVVTVLTAQWGEDRTWLYALRLLGFVLILVGILEKNRTAARR